VQCQAISLMRSIPFALRWLIGPFVTSISRESLAFYAGDNAQDARETPASPINASRPVASGFSSGGIV
jgi:hypothetical protein